MFNRDKYIYDLIYFAKQIRHVRYEWKDNCQLL